MWGQGKLCIHQDYTGVTAQYSFVDSDHIWLIHLQKWSWQSVIPVILQYHLRWKFETWPHFIYWGFVRVILARIRMRTHDEDNVVWRMCESCHWLYFQALIIYTIRAGGEVMYVWALRWASLCRVHGVATQLCSLQRFDQQGLCEN